MTTVVLAAHVAVLLPSSRGIVNVRDGGLHFSRAVTAWAIAAGLLLGVGASLASADDDAKAHQEAVELARVFRAVMQVLGKPNRVVPRERWQCRPSKDGVAPDGTVIWLDCRVKGLRVGVRVGSGPIDGVSFEAESSKLDVFLRAATLLYGVPDSPKEQDEDRYRWDHPHLLLAAGLSRNTEDEGKHAFLHVGHAWFTAAFLNGRGYRVPLDLLELGTVNRFRKLCASSDGVFVEELPKAPGCVLHAVEKYAAIYLDGGKIVGASISEPKEQTDRIIEHIGSRYGEPTSKSDNELTWVTPDGFHLTVFRNAEDYVLYVQATR